MTCSLVLIVVCTAIMLSSNAMVMGLSHVDVFRNFEGEFEKLYQNETERQYRFEVFVENLKTISKLNAASTAAGGDVVFGITKFADHTEEEFRVSSVMDSVGGYSDPCVTRVADDMSLDNLPTSVDWRDSNLVTPVKDQDNCGSCWAFSAVQHIEGLYAKAGHGLVNMSYEQILECDPHDGSCYGGWPSCAFQYMIEQGGLSSQDDYKNGEYLADHSVICLKNQTFNESCVDPPCTWSCDVDAECTLGSGSGQIQVTTRLSAHYSVSQDEAQIAAQLASVGPLSVLLYASSWGFQHYKGGVLDPSERSCPHDELDHGVLLVGYGTDAGKDYWLVKNSWGSKWGEDGYFRIARGKGACGINTGVTVATLRV